MYLYKEGGFVIFKKLVREFHSSEPIFPTQGEQWFCFR